MVFDSELLHLIEARSVDTVKLADRSNLPLPAVGEAGGAKDIAGPEDPLSVTATKVGIQKVEEVHIAWILACAGKAWTAASEEQAWAAPYAGMTQPILYSAKMFQRLETT